MEKRKHIVILAAGDFPTHEIPLRALREADFVVCCDSAYSQFSVFNSQYSIPFVVIGDGDSLPKETIQALGDQWIHVAEQDYNDLHKAMCWATSQFSILDSHFSILGATGRREDHTLGNISYLATFADEYPGIHLEILTDYGCFRIQKTGFNIQSYNSFPHQQVSFFTLDPRTRVTATKLQWPLSDTCLSPWWQGTLNTALSDTFEVSSDGPLIVFQTYDPKIN